MNVKSASITNKLYSAATIFLLLCLWEFVSYLNIIPNFMLPSPIQVFLAFVNDFPLLIKNSVTTIAEAFIGLIIGVSVGFGAACVMDRWNKVYMAAYPLIIVSQTIPTVAIAPLLVLWFGYDMTPKIILIILVSFFPIAVGVLDGLRSVDTDAVNLLYSMGARNRQIFRYIKLPATMPNFFSALRISVSYSIVSAVLAEWLGGFNGLGVYMTRVKKSFSYDKMFAVIFLISAISLLLMWVVNLIEKKCIPWNRTNTKPDD